MSQRRSFLFLISASPWQKTAAGAMDLLMTAAVLDQDVHLCFRGNGVLHLVKDQDGTALNLKTLAQQLPALELYGVTQYYAEGEALVRHGLQADDLSLAVTVLDSESLAALVSSCDEVEHWR